jgi:hypothetical protein
VKSKRTESEVDDDVISVEFGGNIAAGIREVCRRCTPLVSVDFVLRAQDINGHGIVSPLPEPHVDEGVSALDSIPSTAVGIERWPIAAVGV